MADKEAKVAVEIPGITTSRIPYTIYFLAIKRARISEWQR